MSRRQKRRPLIPLGLAKTDAFSDQEIDALVSTPEYYDEESFGGTMPNPEADDDVLKSEQEFGFYTEIDTPESAEMDTQKQLTQAEQARRRRRESS